MTASGGTSRRPHSVAVSSAVSCGFKSRLQCPAIDDDREAGLVGSWMDSMQWNAHSLTLQMSLPGIAVFLRTSAESSNDASC